MAAGLVDTNVFIHALTRDAHAEECLRFLESVERGDVEVRLEPVVAHELTYALPHYRRGMTRDEVAEFLLAVLAWDGVVGDKERLADAVARWRRTPGLAFVDAYLAALAVAEGLPVYTRNVRELRAQGVEAPSPLPAPMAPPGHAPGDRGASAP